MPFSIFDALTIELAQPHELAAKIEAMCDTLRIEDDGRRHLAQCCAYGRIKADDLTVLLDSAPLVLKDPKHTRETVRQAPILWGDFISHLRFEA